MVVFTGMKNQESFKPYYNWTAFNTQKGDWYYPTFEDEVLNLIISGMPSILDESIFTKEYITRF